MVVVVDLDLGIVVGFDGDLNVVTTFDGNVSVSGGVQVQVAVKDHVHVDGNAQVKGAIDSVHAWLAGPRGDDPASRTRLALTGRQVAPATHGAGDIHRVEPK